MNRLLRLPLDTLMHGTAYGALNYLIADPEPLDPERTWALLTGPERPLRKALRKAWPPPWMRELTLRGASRMAMEEAIPRHYDVSNDFYALFLDPRFMFYSCADHLRGDEALEEAQHNKARHLLGLIDPHPGERILELGCGWASMLRVIEEHTGDRENLSGWTLSAEQVAWIREKYGYSVEKKNFVTGDYPVSAYDKVYSIGAWESVRPHEADGALKKVFDALKPGGAFVLHFFCRTADPLPPAAATAQLFFPGHVPMSYGQHVRAFERAGFRVERTSVHDYRGTLRQWFENLAGKRDEALALVPVETWNRYVVFFPASWRYFDERTGVVFRFVLRKP